MRKEKLVLLYVKLQSVEMALLDFKHMNLAYDISILIATTKDLLDGLDEPTPQ